MTAPQVETVEGAGALVVPVNGPVRHVVVPTGATEDIVVGHQLAALREHTGGRYVEHVTGPIIWCSTGRAVALSLWVDEEGALDRLRSGMGDNPVPRPPNPRVDALLRRPDDWSIRGDVVITGEVDPAGDLTSLHADAVTELQGRWS